MSYAAKYHKTHAGKTASEILTNAGVCMTTAGSYEIVTPDFPCAILMSDEDGDLVIDHPGGIVARVLCDDEAKETLRNLTGRCETAMLAIA